MEEFSDEYEKGYAPGEWAELRGVEGFVLLTAKAIAALKGPYLRIVWRDYMGLRCLDMKAINTWGSIYIEPGEIIVCRNHPVFLAWWRRPVPSGRIATTDHLRAEHLPILPPIISQYYRVYGPRLCTYPMACPDSVDPTASSESKKVTKEIDSPLRTLLSGTSRYSEKKFHEPVRIKKYMRRLLGG